MRSPGAAAAVLIGAIAAGVAILRTAPAGRDAAWDDGRIPNLIIRAARDYLPPAQPGADGSALVPAHKP